MGEDRRRWARIEASLECTVATADQTFEAKVANVSRSGLALVAPPNQVKEGETVSVMLERSEGQITLALSGTVVRIFGSGEETVYGVHFDALPPTTELELLMLLKMLAAGRGGGRREYPRISARIAVSCRTVESFGALLNDLSHGGMSIRCPRPVELGSTMSVEFGFEGHTELLTVECTVVHVKTPDDGKHIVGLKFTPPSLQKRERVQQLLDLLMGMEIQDVQDAVIEEDDSDE
jgi:c-di-GMP-binding flagellar brake protein YcgR